MLIVPLPVELGTPIVLLFTALPWESMMVAAPAVKDPVTLILPTVTIRLALDPRVALPVTLKLDKGFNPPMIPLKVTPPLAVTDNGDVALFVCV